MDTNGPLEIVATSTSLDASEAAHVASEVSSALTNGASIIVMNLEKVTLVDPGGVAPLLGAIALARAHGRLLVVAGLPQLRALLLSAPEFSGAQLFATRAAAFAALNPSPKLP